MNPRKNWLEQRRSKPETPPQEADKAAPQANKAAPQAPATPCAAAPIPWR